MIERRATFVAWVLGALVLVPPAVFADEDPNATKVANQATTDPTDAEFLEYLGSVDVEGQDWMDYLSHTDIAQVAKAKKPPDPPGNTDP
jgi:hypothetical protein